MECVIDGAFEETPGDDDEALYYAQLEDRLSSYDLYSMPSGTVMRTHGVAHCGNFEGGEQQACTLHNPSEHHMCDWPLSLSEDFPTLMQRTCTHGLGHPDPDSVAYFRRCGIPGIGVHTCDGCCIDPAVLAEFDVEVPIEAPESSEESK